MPLTFSDILLLTPRSINMLSHSVTPMAYRSLRTLAHAILPYKAQILKVKHIKGLVCKVGLCQISQKRRSIPSCTGHPQWGRCNLSSGPEKGLHVWGGSHRCPCLCLQKKKKVILKRKRSHTASEILCSVSVLVFCPYQNWSSSFNTFLSQYFATYLLL